jgi:long-chain acyl-CoA synthetase
MNLAHLLDGHDPNAVAIISRNRSVSYGELTDAVARARGGLLAAGIRPGERIVILCGNNRHFVVAYLATLGVGAVAVPLNPTSPAPELARELSVVEPVAAVLDPAALTTWQQLDPTTTAGVRLTVVADAAAPDGVVTLDSLLAAEPAPIVAVEPDAVAAMMFTSGTAGPPRAAMLTHGNLRANLDQMDSADDRLLPTDVVYGVLPLFHIFGLNVVLAGALRAGAALLLVQRFDPATAIDSFVQRGVTVVLGAPPIWVAFSTFDDLPSDAFATVRLALSGAARLPPSAAERMKSRFGIDVYEGYGLTEAGPVVTSSAGAARPGSVGRVLDGQEVRLVGPDGGPVMVGDTGEIWVRGANVFAGYYGDPEATARVLTNDGWLRTGDIATVDDAGYLYLVDRAKDMIIVSGFNVFPAEVEEVLGTHPAVAEVGVVGVAHPHHGEAVKAFVVLAEGAHTDEESLIDYAHDYLARYKCPSKVVFVDRLPRNAAGKLVRRELSGTVLA